jgi:Flp pilus assembly protein TadB
MGSKASAPIVIRDQPIVACNMRDMSDWTTVGSTSVLMVVLALVGLCLVFGVILCCMRRHYHRKIREFTHRVPRAFDLESMLMTASPKTNASV